jgi:hypothetical protein
METRFLNTPAALLSLSTALFVAMMADLTVTVMERYFLDSVDPF